MPSNPFKRIIPLAVALGVTTAFVATVPATARDNSQEPAPAFQTLKGRAAVAVVAIEDQRISFYDAHGGAVRARISSGQTNYETPVGVFSILQKEVDHVSNLYDDAKMPFMQRMTWSGVALHAGVLPGYPASHGCVRLPYDFAERIFSMTKLGMRVVISRNDIAPVDIAHRLLPKPQPIGEVAAAIPTAYEFPEADDESATILDPDVRNWPARQALLDTLKAEAEAKAEAAKATLTHWETLKDDLKNRKREVILITKRDRAAELKGRAEARYAKSEKRVTDARSPRAKTYAKKENEFARAALASAEAKLVDATMAAEQADSVIAQIKEQISAAETAKTAAVAAAAEAKRKTLPISIFVSAKSQKLYVRQGNEPVFDAKVTVSDNERPIGTHVFTALDFVNDGNNLRWNVVSIAHGSVGQFDDDRDRGRRSRKMESLEPPLTDVSSAAAALERVSIPAEVRARISQYVWPGSSLIISDEELSKETGKGTDFIVVASNEPHGALKKRPRQPPPDTYRDYYDDDYYFFSDRRNYRYERRRPRYNSFLNWW